MSGPPAHLAPVGGWSRWQRSWWYHAVVYAQTWRGSVVGAVVLPFLFLLAMGVGVGHLVAHHHGKVGGQSYLDFLAPSLLATTAMQLGSDESLWPVLGAIKWIRTYHAAAATPLEPEDVFVGKLSWVLTRALATSIIYTAVIGIFGALHSWWALTLPLVGGLVAVAFAAPLITWAARAQSDGPFVTYYRFATVPMFLFSATFYPVSAYPAALRPLVQIAPLYHGVALARAAASGHAQLGAIAAHVSVLAAMGAVGVVLGRRAMRRRLVD